ncbi:MAG: BrnT family toxin [Sandarakinorhabdus sp.]
MIHFEWDAAKAAQNERKHGVAFELATQVFADPLHITRQDRIENYELRWQTVGMVGGVRLLLVAHLWRDEDGMERIRIISARPATPRERRQYEQQDG